MKTHIAIFLLVLVAAICFPQAGHAQTTPPITPPTTFTEDQLRWRFTQILAKELDVDDVFLSFRATYQLAAIVQHAAAEMIKSNRMEELPVADENFKRFATALIEKGRAGSNRINLTPKSKPTTNSGESKITFQMIDEVLGERSNSEASGANKRRGLCPLFPICK